MKEHLNPGCYAFMQGERYLYVGSTKNLDERPAKRDKGHESRWSAIMLATHTQLFHCESVIQAKHMEEQLITAHRPEFNLRRAFGPADIERTAQIIRDNW